jgi:hypothetical protein
MIIMIKQDPPRPPPQPPNPINIPPFCMTGLFINSLCFLKVFCYEIQTKASETTPKTS